VSFLSFILLSVIVPRVILQSVILLSVILVSVILLSSILLGHFVECILLIIILLSVIRLMVTLLSVILLIVILLSVILLSVLLSVILMSIILLGVVLLGSSVELKSLVCWNAILESFVPLNVVAPKKWLVLSFPFSALSWSQENDRENKKDNFLPSFGQPMFKKRFPVSCNGRSQKIKLNKLLLIKWVYKSRTHKHYKYLQG
jgi:hypothetical protein